MHSKGEERKKTGKKDPWEINLVSRAFVGTSPSTARSSNCFHNSIALPSTETQSASLFWFDASKVRETTNTHTHTHPADALSQKKNDFNVKALATSSDCKRQLQGPTSAKQKKRRRRYKPANAANKSRCLYNHCGGMYSHGPTTWLGGPRRAIWVTRSVAVSHVGKWLFTLLLSFGS